MNAAQQQQVHKEIGELQEQMFDASALLRCLVRALEADGHEDRARAASAISSHVSSIAIAFDKVFA